MKTLNIPTTSGFMDVACSKEVNCNNLCVTMTHFGLFEVTHIDSGRKLFGNFERAASATVEVLKIERYLISIGIDRSLPMAEFQEVISSQKEKVESLCGMTILEYIKFCASVSGFSGEFPWEAYEDSPFFTIESLREEVKWLTTKPY